MGFHGNSRRRWGEKDHLASDVPHWGIIQQSGLRGHEPGASCTERHGLPADYKETRLLYFGRSSEKGKITVNITYMEDTASLRPPAVKMWPSQISLHSLSHYCLHSPPTLHSYLLKGGEEDGPQVKNAPHSLRDTLQGEE